MGFVLDDGHGGGNKARVNKDGSVFSLSTQVSEESIVSIRDGLAFFAHTGDTADTLTSTATKGQYIYLENTNSSGLVLALEAVFFSCSAGSVSYTFQRNPTVGSIGANNTHTPTNANFSSGKTADATCYTWDETGTGMTGITAGTELATFLSAVGTIVHPIQGSIILEKGDSFSVTVDALSGTPEVSITIRFYYIDPEKII